MLEDTHGRQFPYLRLSVTQVCNFRCGYCLPNGYQKGDRHFLTPVEMARLVKAFAMLGTYKVRLTGGEPCVRADLLDCVAAVKATTAIKTIALTTNGYNLKAKAKNLFEAGVNALNVSVDSLNREKFHQITGMDKLRDVLLGIDCARHVGFEKIKINSVLLKEGSDAELELFLSWIKREDLSVRFIELMQTGDNVAFFKPNHLGAIELEKKLLGKGFVLMPRAPDAGPAREYTHPEYVGTIGIIAPYSKDFCASCNRLRVTALGGLMLCLFGEGGYDLRYLLQNDEDTQELISVVRHLLISKDKSHYLQQGRSGSTKHLALFGG